MTNLIKFIFLLSASFVFSALAHADDRQKDKQQVNSTAKAYMTAYRSFDLDKMATFYHEDSVFTDPTSEIWGEHAFNMKGKKEIVRRLKGFLDNYNSVKLDFRVSNSYEAAGHVIYLGKAKLTFDNKGVISTTCAILTTIITVKNDKVMEHRDYFDYDTSRKNQVKGDQVCFTK